MSVELFTTTARKLRDALSVVYAVDKGNPRRPALNGVLLEVGEAGYACTACDGYRLAHVDYIPYGLYACEQFVLDAKECRPLRTALRGLKNSPVTCERGEQSVTFRWDTGEWPVATSDTPYPNYRLIVPDNAQLAPYYQGTILVRQALALLAPCRLECRDYDVTHASLSPRGRGGIDVGGYRSKGGEWHWWETPLPLELVAARPTRFSASVCVHFNHLYDMLKNAPAKSVGLYWGQPGGRLFANLGGGSFALIQEGPEHKE